MCREREGRQVIREPTAKIRANLAADFRGYCDGDLFGFERHIVAVA